MKASPRTPGETMLHELKTWPEPFGAIEQGTKHHEIRKNDRHFVLGDLLQLREWDPSTEQYTGRERTVRVSYVTNGGTWGLPEDICVMSIERGKVAQRARLDAEGTAKPMTEIVAVMPPYEPDGRMRTLHVGQATHYVARPTLDFDRVQHKHHPGSRLPGVERVFGDHYPEDDDVDEP